MKAVFHFIIGLFFCLLIGVMTIQNNLNLLMSQSDDYKKITIYFKQSTLEKEVDQFVTDQLGQSVEKVNKITKEQALVDFKNTFGDFSQNLSGLDVINDLIPLSLEVVFSDEAEKKSFLDKFTKNELIDEVVSTDKVFSRYASIHRSLNGFLVLFFSISFLLCALLTALLVKNIVYKDKNKIEIYALFGKSYHEIIKEYFKSLFKFFSATVVLSFVFVFLVFLLFKYKLSASAELNFLTERLSFLSVLQIIFLISCFTLSYFSGLYLVLRKSVQGSFSRA